MTEDKEKQFEIGKGYYVRFDGTNMSYREWYEKSEAMTASRMDGCWEAVKNNYQDVLDKEENNLNDEDRSKLKKNKKAVEYLTLALYGPAYRAVKKGKSNAYEINQYLKKRYYKQTMDEMVTIEDKIGAVSMQEDEDPSDMAGKLEELNDHLSDIDAKLEKTDQQMISIFLNKLPKEKYLTFTEGIRAKSMDKLTYDEVVNDATDYYERNIQTGRDKETTTGVFNTYTRGPNNNRGGGKPKFNGVCRIPWCRKKGHKAIDCFLNPKSSNCKPELMKKAKKEYYEKRDSAGNNANSEDITCFRCGGKGHKSFECTANRRQEANSVQSLFAGSTTVVNAAEEVPDNFFDTFNTDPESHDDLDYEMEQEVSGRMMKEVEAHSVATTNHCEESDLYAADSGASEHFVVSDTHMYNHQEPTKSTAMTTNGQKTKIDAVGDVDIESNGVRLTLTRANHVNAFKKNLISIGRCIDDGWRVMFRKNMMIMEKDGNMLKFNRGDDNIYYLHGKRVPTSGVSKGTVALNSTTAEAHHDKKERIPNEKTMNINEAHDKFGHPSEALLRKTTTFYGIKLTGKLESCEACARAKAKQKSVAKTTEVEETYVGERLYLDQSGPFEKTWNGKRYLQCAVDGYSRAGFMNLAATKDEIVPWFETILQTLKNNNTPVKCVRADPAGENVQALTRLCNKQGVKLELTPAGTPQMNGKVERKQTVIIYKALAGMHAANLKESTRHMLWGESARYANDTINITANSVTDKSPYELFTGEKSKLIPHMQPFGRIGEVTIKRKIKGKWTEKSQQMIMVGYAKNTTPDTYRMYNPKTRKVLETRDITWMDWTRQDPQRDASIFNQQPETIAEKPGIDEKHLIVVDDEPAPDVHVIPDDDESVTAAGRNEQQRTADTNSDNEPEPIPAAEQQTTAIVPAPKTRLSRALRQLDTYYNPTTQQFGLGRTRNTNRAEIFSPEPRPLSREEEQGGETTATVVEPDDTAHTVHFVFNTEVASDPGEPKNAEEAFNHPDPIERMRWRKSGMTEFNNFLGRNIWSKYPRKKVKETGRKIVGTKVVFKKKNEAVGSTAPDTYGTIRYKTRGVTLGYQQIPGIDYTESFSPVATDTAIRITISISLYYDDWVVHVMDIEAAFLEGKLQIPMFIEWLPGMVELGYLTQEEADEYVCMLTGGMYGNVQAALEFFREYRAYLMKLDKMNMKQSLTDPCLFYKKVNGKLVLIALIHVDDTLVAGPPKWVQWYKEMVGLRFKYRDEGKLKKHLGVWYEWKTDPETKERCVVATMPQLVNEIIEAYEKYKGGPVKEYDTPGYPNQSLKKHLEEAMDPKEYRSIVGKYMYLVTKIMPEGANTARDLTKHFQNPGPDQWKSVERMVGYLKKHKDNIKLTYRKPKELRPTESADSDYNTAEDRRSVNGNLGTVGGCITNWLSNTQHTTSMSSTEAEYYSAAKAVQTMLFKINLLNEITRAVTPGILAEDNTGCIFLIKNQATSSRTKHIDIRAHLMREHYMEGRFDVVQVDTEEQDADILTKNLPEKDYTKHAQNLREGRPYIYQNWDDIVMQAKQPKNDKADPILKGGCRE